MRSTIHTNLKIKDDCTLRRRFTFRDFRLLFFLWLSLLWLLLLLLLLFSLSLMHFFWSFLTFLTFLTFKFLLFLRHLIFYYFINQISNISYFLNNTLNLSATSFLFAYNWFTFSSSINILSLNFFSFYALKVDYPKSMLLYNFAFLLSNNTLWRDN